jgi:hypothetical protein
VFVGYKKTTNRYLVGDSLLVWLSSVSSLVG